MLNKVFEDSDHKLKIMISLLALFVSLFVILSQPAQSAVVGKALTDDTYNSTLLKVHGFHCNRSGGHAHRSHCPGSRQCYQQCYPFALYRFNCKNLLQFCLQNKNKNRLKCRLEYRKCTVRAKDFCKSACRR